MSIVFTVEKITHFTFSAGSTYAEVMSIKGDDMHFYEYLEKALQNRNPTEGITAALYANDQRWARFRQEKRFQDLLKRYWK